MGNNNDQTSDRIAARGALLEFYSGRCVAFGGFFIAAIFGILTVLTLVQGIFVGTAYVEVPLIVLSLIVYGIFGYVGLFVLKGFSHYVNIADMLEGGRTIPGDLRDYAALNEMKFKDKDGKETNVTEEMNRKYGERKNSVGKVILSDSKKLKGAYIILLVLLGIIAYVPLIYKLFLP